MSRYPAASSSRVDRLFGDHLVHGNVVGLAGDFGEELALERQADQGRVGPDPSQQPVVVSLPVPQAPALPVEGYSGHQDQIELGGVDPPAGGRSQVGSWLRDAVRPGGQLADGFQEEQSEPVADAVGHDKPLAELGQRGEERAGADFAAEMDVAHHRGSGNVLRQGGDPVPDEPAEPVLIGLGVPLGVRQPAYFVLQDQGFQYPLAIRKSTVALTFLVSAGLLEWACTVSKSATQ